MALALLVKTSLRVESQQNKGEIEKEKMRVKGVGKTQVQTDVNWSRQCMENAYRGMLGLKVGYQNGVG